MTTIILPKPSRFDKLSGEILSGNARWLVDEAFAGEPYKAVYAGSVARGSLSGNLLVTGSPDPIWPGGDLNKLRGTVYHMPHPTMFTFWPQDCVDILDYEGSDDGDTDDESTGKDAAPTKRSNFRFWFKRDVAKLLSRPLVPIKPITFAYNYVTPPQARDILASSRGPLTLDIESDPGSDTLTCFSFCFGDGPVYTALVYDYRDKLVPGVPAMMAALQGAMLREKLILHNAAFDLGFLHIFCGLAFGDDIEDTMLMGHRIFPEAEKSLAHAISLWLNEPYHKDQATSWRPRSYDQQNALLRYNSRDVYTQRAVWQAQREYVSHDPALLASVNQVNSSIYPYLWTSLRGLDVDAGKLLSYLRSRKARADELARIIRILVGHDINPGSTQQMARYFHDEMDYPVVGKTDTGAAAVDETAMYKLLIKTKSPVASVALAYKRAAKVGSMLGFKYYEPSKKR